MKMRSSSGIYMLSISALPLIFSTSLLLLMVPQGQSNHRPLDAVIAPVSENLRDEKHEYGPGEEVLVKLALTNNSANAVDVIFGGTHSQNTLHLLTSNGGEMPFLNRIRKVIDARRNDNSMIDARGSTSIPAGKMVTVEILNLNKWYGELPPGNYRLWIERNFRYERNGQQPIKSNTISFSIKD